MFYVIMCLAYCFIVVRLSHHSKDYLLSSPLFNITNNEFQTETDFGPGLSLSRFAKTIVLVS